MITPRGAGCLAAAVALFFLARLTQVGWVYLLDSVLWGALLLSAVLPWLTTLFLAAHRSQPGPATPVNGTASRVWPDEDSQIEIQVSLRNRVFWPRFLLNVDYWCPAAEPGHQLIRIFLAKLNGSRRTRLTSPVQLHQRGNHLLGPVFAESSAPFGMFRRRCRLTPPEPILVYPKVHSLSRLPVADVLVEAAAHSKHSRLGLEPAGARRYAPGDPRRHIHWRNTARMGQPMVKEFDDPSQSVLHLVFDSTQAWGEGRETTLEYAIKIVASAAYYAYGIRVPVQVYGGGIQASRHGDPNGCPTWNWLMGRLASVALGDGDELSKTLEGLPPGSNVLVAAGLADASAAQSLARITPFHQRMVVISLEDFGEEGAGSPEIYASTREALEMIENAGASVVRCRRGQLIQAMDALSKVEAFGRASIRPVRQDGPPTVSQNVPGPTGG